MFAAIMRRVWPYLAAIGAAFVAIAAVYLKGQGAGAAKEQAKAARREIAARDEQLEMYREATEAERAAAAMTDKQAREEAMKWARR